ncbi:methylamine utilization protein [Marinobacter sp. VGCF2001]|uniref:methylamine utilization protein n=1 Tax=Marinobacter sp. VGCF2001 TaxID=3417189 RepID=UPI003CEF5B38
MNFRCLILICLLFPVGQAMARELALTVTSAEGPVSDAVVFLDQGPDIQPVSAEMGQKNRQFEPQLLIIPAGSTVDFPNHDRTEHHVYSFSPAKTFELELYSGQPEAPVSFPTPGIVELGCNIHDHMQAFILVMSNAAYGVTDKHGRITLNVPGTEGAGVDINLWHSRLPDNIRALQLNVQPPSATVRLDLVPEPEPQSPLDQLQLRFRDL